MPEITAKDAAKKYGVGLRTVQQWTTQGDHPLPVAGRRPLRFDADVLDDWISKLGRPLGRPGRPSPQERARQALAHAGYDASILTRKQPDPPVYDHKAIAALVADLDEAKLEKARWDAHIVKLKALKLQEQLIPREDVERERLERIQAVIGVMDGAPSKWARKFLGLTREEDAEQLVRKMLHDMREEFART